MKYPSTSAALLLAVAQSATAYPGILREYERHASAGLLEHPVERSAAAVPEEKAVLRKRVGFDPKTQYVSTTGDHAFVAPGPTDQRGPCPGLNAMANHGYLPHNGIATIDQFITGTYDVFGMGTDLATVLAVYGAVFDGDLTKWSIGGPDARVGLLNLLGTPQGISGSHNKYEGDASPTRGDLYQYGNDYEVVLSQFQELYSKGQPADNYDLDLLTEQRANRFNQSINENPYFFNAPFSGVVAQPAAWSFIYRFMANKSSEYPEGRLNGEVLKSFYAITGESGNFQYTPGHERIPDNWYKRAIGDEYTVPYLSADSNVMLLKHLEFASVGGNTGKTNSFVGLAPEDLTGGVFNAATLAQGNNAMCYGLELSIQETPDLLSGIFTDTTNPLNKVLSALGDAADSLGCPKLTQINTDQFSQFPGYTNLKSDGQY